MALRARAVLLNGPSSSGKSTLANALRDRIRERTGEAWKIVSIDDFMKTDPGEPIWEDDVFEVSGEICGEVLEALRTGPGVIIDHVITSERIFEGLAMALGPLPVLKVRVSCAPEILRERERLRGDRCPGSAESSDRYLYPKDGYDLTVDTGALPPEEAAEAVAAALFRTEG